MAGHPDRIAAVPPLWVRTMTEVGPLPGEGFPSSPSAHPGQNPTETHRGRGKGVGRLRDISAQEMALDAKHTGCMVALYPNRTDAEKLAIRGGEPPEQLHVTLAFLGEARNIDEQVLTEVVRNWAAITPQISGTISGYGYFLEGPKPVTYWSVDLPRLPEHREALVLALEAAGVPPKKDHGFVPHMTVAYAKRRDKPPVGHRFRFGSAVVAYADKRTRFPFGGISQSEYAKALAMERRRRGL